MGFKNYFGFEINRNLVIDWVVSSRKEIEAGGGSVKSL